DRAMISAVMSTVSYRILQCPSDGFDGMVKVSVKVSPYGRVTGAVPLAGTPALKRCITEAIQAVAFPPTTQGGSFSYPFVFAKTSRCDSQILVDRGKQALSAAKYGEALAEFEAAL